MPDKESKSQKRFPSFVPEETAAHARAARRELQMSIETFLPPGFVQHRNAARREILLAFRSLIDSALDRAEDSQPEAE